MGKWNSFMVAGFLAILPASNSAVFGQAEASAREPYVVVHGWPQLPADFALGQISGVGVDSHNHVFVFNRAENSSLCLGGEAACPPPAPTWQPGPIASPAILTFDGKTGKQLAAWGKNRFVSPHGLGVDSHDNVWATDVTLQQVFEFSNDGRLLLTLGTERKPGLDGTHFNAPTAIAFAPDGSIYISDGYGNSRVAKFSASGKFLLDWGHKGSGPGEFNTPHGVAVDRQGLVYVADRENSRIQVFDPNGKFLRMWKSDELVSLGMSRSDRTICYTRSMAETEFSLRLQGTKSWSRVIFPARSSLDGAASVITTDRSTGDIALPSAQTAPSTWGTLIKVCACRSSLRASAHR